MGRKRRQTNPNLSAYVEPLPPEVAAWNAAHELRIAGHAVRVAREMAAIAGEEPADVIHKVCSVCRRKFDVPDTRSQGQRLTCSQHCRALWRARSQNAAARRRYGRSTA